MSLLRSCSRSIDGVAIKISLLRSCFPSQPFAPLLTPEEFLTEDNESNEEGHAGVGGLCESWRARQSFATATRFEGSFAASELAKITGLLLFVAFVTSCKKSSVGNRGYSCSAVMTGSPME
jgi:hypothetical protein